MSKVLEEVMVNEIVEFRSKDTAEVITETCYPGLALGFDGDEPGAGKGDQGGP